MKRGFIFSGMADMGVGSAVAALLLLAGCGGGGGGGGGGGVSPLPAASALGGVAAVGYPIINGTVQVKCAGGSTLTVTTTSAGAWQATISGQTLPCAVQVSGGTINGAANPTPYHSIATSFGAANVTPLTDLMVANLAGTATPGVWFAGLTPAAFAQITTISVNTALTNLRIALSGLTPLSTVNPITTAFAATSGTTGDDMLVALKTAMTNTGVTYTALLSNASAPGFTPPAGFGTALATAWNTTSSGAGPVASTLTFPLQSGYSARIANGSSTNYTISGTCSGTASYVTLPPVAAAFEGVPALGAAATNTLTYTQCTAQSFTTTGTIYHNTSYARLGSSSVGQYFVSTTPIIVPASVKVGDTGTLGTENIYTNSTKAALLGRYEYSYVVEPDTANTAIINRITKAYDPSSALVFTQQDKMGIASNGALTPLSIDYQSNTTTEHFIFTATDGGGATGGTGVTFSGTLLGFTSVANTSRSYGGFVAGGKAFTVTEHMWADANGAIAWLSYFPSNNRIRVSLPYLFTGTECGVNSTVIFLTKTYPACSSVGITFNRASGVITFTSTPILYLPGAPTGITATGSLSFSPF